MKKNLGSKLALYPMPLLVVGTMKEGSPTWTLVGHTGIIGHDRVMVSLFAKHDINRFIKANGSLTINYVNEGILTESDYCGIASGAKTDKSSIFKYTVSENGAPIIDKANLVLECKVEEVLDMSGFDNVICSITSTYVEEKCMTDEKIDYLKVKPLLFDMPNYNYYTLGKMIGKGATFGKSYGKNN